MQIEFNKIFAYRFFSYHFNQKANYIRGDILSIQKIYSKRTKKKEIMTLLCATSHY